MLHYQFTPSPREDRVDDGLPMIIGTSHVPRDPEWSCPLHAHDDVTDVVLQTEGRGLLYYGNHRYPTEQGDLFVFNRGALHGEAADPENPCSSLNISLTNIHIEGLPEGHILPASVLPILKTGRRFGTILGLFQIMRTEFLKNPGSFASISQPLVLCLFNLMQQLMWQPVQVQPMRDDSPLGRQVKEYLDDHFTENVKLETLAKEFHFSPYHLSHVFKEYSSYSVNQYITERRIGEAQRLLMDTDLSIGDISKQMGYENLNHFYVMFKKLKGASPGVVREQIKRKRIGRESEGHSLTP